MQSDIQVKFSKQEARLKVGRTIVALVEFSGVPKGTKGKIISIGQAGAGPEEWDVKIQWELPNRAKPLVDWFSRGEYEKYLREVRIEYDPLLYNAITLIEILYRRFSFANDSSKKPNFHPTSISSCGIILSCKNCIATWTSQGRIPKESISLWQL